MTTMPRSAELQRWTDELARNPDSPVFLQLARACRRQDRRDLALSLCHHGLERNPQHVEGRALCALLYLEAGDHARAAEEWSTILRLEPDNFDALRGLGFRYFEQGDIPKATRHLELASLVRPSDAAVREALRLLWTRTAESAGDAPEPPAVETRKHADDGSSGEERTGTHAELTTTAGRGQKASIVTIGSVSNARANEDVPVLEPADGAAAVEESGAAVEPGADPRRLFHSILRRTDLAFLLLIFLMVVMLAMAATVIHFSVSALWSDRTVAADERTPEASEAIGQPDMTTAADERTPETLEPTEPPDETEIPAPPPPPEPIARPAIAAESDFVIEDDNAIGTTRFDEDSLIELLTPPPALPSADVPASSTFTPVSVIPELQNPEEVERALARSYPPGIRAAGIGGRATVWAFIDEEGRVVDTELNESSGIDQLDRAAIQVVEVMRFSPGWNRETKVPVWVSVPIRFDPR